MSRGWKCSREQESALPVTMRLPANSRIAKELANLVRTGWDAGSEDEECSGGEPRATDCDRKRRG